MATPLTTAGLLLKSPFVVSVSSMHCNMCTRETRSAFLRTYDLGCSAFLHLFSCALCQLMPSSLISPDGLMLFAAFIFFVNFGLVTWEDLCPPSVNLASLAGLARLAYSEDVLIAADSDTLLIWHQPLKSTLWTSWNIFWATSLSCYDFLFPYPDWLAKNLQCETRAQPQGGDLTNVLLVTFHADQLQSI